MQAGQTIAGRYRLNRILGSGGMATVWSATNVFTDREFAIKFMLPQVARTPEAARRFLLEAKVSGRINHPYVIEIIDVGQAEDGSLFLVMELLTGMSLDTAVRRQRPPMLVHEFLALMRDVAEALAAAHRCGVVHRDLKPTNVFLHKDRDGRTVPKVLDFGVSKVIEKGSDSLTVVGTILGSPLYMSPEQAMGAEGIDGRTDVFAFGSMLFEALVGHRAYAATNLNALIVAIATTAPESIDEAAPQMPGALRALVRECMIADKEHRLASFDLIVERLDGLLIELAVSDLRLPIPARRADPTPEPPPIAEIPRAIDRGLGGSGSVPLRTAQDSAGASPIPVAIHMSQAGQHLPSGTASSSSWLSRSGFPDGRITAASGAVGGLLALCVIGAAAVLVRQAGNQPRAVAVRPPTGVAVPAAASAAKGAAPAAQDEPASPPVISVDSLPVAAHSGSARTRTSGRLTVAATPGSCVVSIDGVVRGPTPLASLELGPGAHEIECIPPTGPAQTAHVVVAEGTEGHYQFALGR
jgi:serine/threonine-protein kinase